MKSAAPAPSFAKLMLMLMLQPLALLVFFRPGAALPPAASAPPCPPKRCPKHPLRTYCPSDPTPGQCDQVRHGPCPPCQVRTFLDPANLLSLAMPALYHDTRNTMPVLYRAARNTGGACASLRRLPRPCVAACHRMIRSRGVMSACPLPSAPPSWHRN